MLELLTFLIIMCIYLAPTLIADNYNKKNRNTIMALNVFLGWTGWIWLICLIWAVVDDKVVKVKCR